MMEIEFSWAGLTLRAEVGYTPGIPGKYYGPPEDSYPAEDADIEILDLTCDGKDASFLLFSGYSEAIFDAALMAAEEQYQEEVEAALEDRYEAP